MNKDQFGILRMVEGCSSEKAAFLKRILVSASKSFDHCVARDAQRLTGELNFQMHTECQSSSYGENEVGMMRERGGNMHTFVDYTFRERKTLKDFDWSNFGTVK